MSATPYYRVDPEHSGTVGQETWILGPPGCGKTTFLSGSIRNTALLRGSDNVAATSFTTAAAAELAGRDLPLPKSQIGTLHSLAYRSLEFPRLADELIGDWNEQHPNLTRTGKATNVDDGTAPVEAVNGASEGDVLAAQLDNLRSRLVPREQWPLDVAVFARTWEAWKRDNDVVDFTDLIEMASEHVPTAPGSPDVIFCDETQDMTPAELALVRKWGQHAERLILAGDPHQAIYGFRGATPDAWLDHPVPDSDKIVLSQSWRIPSTVHGAAEHWIRQLSRYEPMRYDPRDEPGDVRTLAVHYQQPHMLADALERAIGRPVVDENGDEKPATVMVLATCAYMLDRVKHELRARGLPFANRWRPTRGDWNPLRSSGKGTSSRERLVSYLMLDERPDVGMGDLSRPWTGDDVRRWAGVVKRRGVFVHGVGPMLEALPDGELSFDEVAALFVDDEQLEAAVTPDLGWLERNLATAKRAGMEFPIRVAQARGARALLTEPQITLGTIHSTKGAEASDVFLIPDLSARGMNEWRQPGPAQDGVRRLMYVGMTRARRSLTVLQPGTGLFVPVEQLVAGARRQAA
jgi:superfamily I DNA/RNA helicase